MANLLAHSAKGVQRRLDNASRLLSSNDKDVNDELTASLREMISAVKEDERALYKRLGVLDYKDFMSKLDSIKVQELDFLLSRGQVVKHYVRNYVFPEEGKQEDAVEYLKALIEDNLPKITSIIDEEIFNGYALDITNNALEYIREVFRQGRVGRKGYLRYFGKAGEKVGIGKLQFKLVMVEKNGVITPQIEITSQDGEIKISRDIINKIIARLQPKSAVYIKVAFPTVQSFKDNVSDSLLMIAPTSWKNILTRVLKEKNGTFEISRSYSGLVGFLGEVRAVAILYRLFGNAAAATGGLQENIKGSPQISIDAIVKMGFNYLGFQVKNYTLNEGKAALTGRNMTSLHFIKNRLCLTGSLEDMLSELFSVYQFNQPYKSESLIEKYEKTDYPVGKYEEEVYSQVQKAAEGLQHFFESRVGYILRIGHSFGLKQSSDPEINKIFGSPKNYYNSFWFIEGHYIPSSVILQSILDQIETGALQQLANVSYQIYNAKGMVLENYLNKKVPVQDAALETQKISYTVTLDVSKLKQRALNGI